MYDEIIWIIILLGLAILSGPIAVLTVFGLKRRIATLERAVAQLYEELLRRTGGVPSPTPPSVSSSEIAQPAPPLSAPPVETTYDTVTAYIPPEPSTVERFLSWLKEDWLVKLGGLIILLGFAWLTTYAFMNNWIGPMGRITLGLTAGAALMAFGFRRMQSFVHQGGIFLVLGSSVVLLTTFAARSLYDIFTPLSALVLMFLSTAMVAFAGVRHRSHAVAACALLLAAIVPLLVASGRTDWVGLFSYLLMVVLGTLWVVWFTGWRDLIVAALLAVGFYSMGYLSVWHEDDRLLLFGYLFSAIFFLAFAVSIIRRGPSKERLVDVLAILGNGVFVTMWVLGMVEKEWQSLVLTFWALVFSVGAYLTSLISERKDPFYLHAAVAIGMIGIATAQELEGALLAIAYTIEVALLVLGVLWYTKNLRSAEVASALFVVPGVMSLGSLGSYSSGAAYGSSSISNWGYLDYRTLHELPLFDQDFFAVLTFILIAGAVGYGLVDARKREGNTGIAMGSILVGIASVVGLSLFWFFIHRAIEDSGIATFVSLTIYTVLGIAFYARGRTSENKVKRHIGIALLIFVVGRLFLVDFWTLDMATKIIVSFVVGALLMATAFISKRK